jgi:DNA (cytosine-5)-methyltransferase 1
MATWAGWRGLDLGCGVGISTDGYVKAGAKMTGIDLNPDVGEYYPGEFQCRDMLTVGTEELRSYDFVHVGPPCQRWSRMLSCRPGLAERYPDLITPMRPRLIEAGVPYVIENVENAPLEGAVWLCGLMFGFELYRHRGFEAGNGLVIPRLRHPEHTMPASKAGHWVPGTVMSIAGHAAPIARARQLMDVARHVPREMLVEAAPGYMTAYVAAHMTAYLSREAALWRTL